MKQQNWMQIQLALCLILHYYNLTFIKNLLRGQTCGKWTKKNQNAPLCTAVSPCMSSFIMHGQKWLILFFPSPRLCCCCCCLTQYSVVATAITYGTMFGLGTALAYTPPLGVAMRWFPKSKVPFIYYVSTFFCFWGALLARDLYIGKNQKLCQNQTSK